MSKWADEIVLYGNPVVELDRLRAALEEIASDPTGTSIYQAEIAKAALQPKEGEK